MSGFASAVLEAASAETGKQHNMLQTVAIALGVAAVILLVWWATEQVSQRRRWRREAERSLRDAESRLMRASTAPMATEVAAIDPAPSIADSSTTTT